MPERGTPLALMSRTTNSRTDWGHVIRHDKFHFKETLLVEVLNSKALRISHASNLANNESQTINVGQVVGKLATLQGLLAFGGRDSYAIESRIDFGRLVVYSA